MFGRLGDSFTELLAVSRFVFGVSWFLALVRAVHGLACACLQYAGLKVRH